MNNTKIKTVSIPFEQHAAAAVKVDRLRDMVIDEIESMDDPEATILAQIAELEKAVKAIFAPKRRGH
jgi:hypothetical protein